MVLQLAQEAGGEHHAHKRVVFAVLRCGENMGDGVPVRLGRDSVAAFGPEVRQRGRDGQQRQTAAQLTYWRQAWSLRCPDKSCVELRETLLVGDVAGKTRRGHQAERLGPARGTCGRTQWPALVAA